MAACSADETDLFVLRNRNLLGIQHIFWMFMRFWYAFCAEIRNLIKNNHRIGNFSKNTCIIVSYGV